MNKKNISISFLFVLIVFLSNFIVPSQVNGFSKGINFSLKKCWENPHSTLVFESRFHNAEFSRRPFVLAFQNWTNSKFDFPYQFSFNLINFSCLLLLFLSLPRLSKTISRRSDFGLLLQITFLLSLPILCAFYGSISTYDDIVQYLFLSIFMIFLFEKKHVLSALFFLLACISRETSLIYILLVFAYFYQLKNWKFYQLLIWVSPVVLYAFFIYGYLDENTLSSSKSFLLEKRFLAWQSNFKDFKTLRETSTILLIMLGFPIYFLIKKIKQSKTSNEIFWSQFSIFFLIINSIIVLISGLVREVRLLFVPLCFVFPLVIPQVKIFLIDLKNRVAQFELKKEIIIIIISFLIAFFWYTPIVIGTGYIFKMYIWIYLILFLEIFYSKLFVNESA